MKKPSIVYTRTLEMLYYLITHGSKQSTFKESLDYQGYTRDEAGDTFKLFQDIYIVLQGLHDGLSPGASKFVNKIGDELHMNNALWYHKPKNSRESTTLKELRHRFIVLKSEDPYIFFVNPIFIRRGTIQAVLAMTMKELKGLTKPTTDNIRELRYKGRIAIDPIEITNSDFLPPSVTKLLRG